MKSQVVGGSVQRKGRGFKEDADLHADVRRDASHTNANQSRGAGAGPAPSIEGWCIFVTGINEETQEEDVNDVFAEFGPVQNVYMNLDRRTGFVKGYAIIEYERFEQADAAVQRLDGAEVWNQVLSVNWCFSSQPLKKQ